jgi:hypothetical protein
MAAAATATAALAPRVAGALGHRDRADAAEARGVYDLHHPGAPHQRIQLPQRQRQHRREAIHQGIRAHDRQRGESSETATQFDMTTARRFAEHIPFVRCTDGIVSELGSPETHR